MEETEDVKKCSKCEETFPLDCFYSSKNGRLGKDSECKECHKKRSVSFYKSNPDKAKEYQKRYRDRNKEEAKCKRFQTKYGITLSEYEKLKQDQLFRCKICDIHEDDIENVRMKELVVDHCHKTGKVRGLLCDQCNRGLGFMKDDVDVLNKAIKYLQQ